MEMEISTTQLVPGDIVKIEEGLNVPADLRVSEAWQCKVDESALTGESMPTKVNEFVLPPETLLADRKNMFTWVRQSQQVEPIKVVTSTGMYTELGKIANDMLKQRPQNTLRA